MSRWIGVAGAALIVGGVAWFLKLAVIIATNGRMTDTGAAGVFFTLGFVLLLVGSTGIGIRLTMNRALPVRLVAAVLSPVGLIAVLVALGAILGPLVGDWGPDYARGEANIVATAVLALVAGALMLASPKESTESQGARVT